MIMEERSVIHSTFVIERSYPESPERVFAAFADAEKKRRWFVEGENKEVEEFEMDFRVGATERARFRFKQGTPLKGVVFTNDSSYQDIVPNRRIVTALQWPSLRSASRRLWSRLNSCRRKRGRDLIVTHQGAFFEGADGPEMREEGWRTLLDRLTAVARIDRALRSRPDGRPARIASRPRCVEG